MDVSIILASYNGAGTLPRTLEALAQVTAPPGGIEVILVDNNSSDATHDLMQAFALDHGAVVLFEPRQGKAFALNAALDVAQGEFIVFTDDDTIADRKWIGAFLRAAQEAADMSVYAGQIRPEWDHPAPEWAMQLADSGSSFGCTSIHATKGPCPPTFAKGANFMVGANAIENLRFDEGELNFGATGAIGGGEDTDFVIRATESSGGQVWYAPDAVVRHIIHRHEMTMRAVFKRYMRIGAGLTKMQNYTRIGVAGTIMRSVVLVAAYFVAFQRNRAIGQIVTLATQIGRLKALMRP